MNEQKYFAVKTKCGHVRKSKYIEITFAVTATSKKKAAEVARLFPRVKHDHKDAILDVTELTKEQYLELLKSNDNDIYLKVKNVQEQKLYCTNLYERMLDDTHNTSIETKTNRRDNIEYIKRKNQLIRSSSLKQLKEYLYC